MNICEILKKWFQPSGGGTSDCEQKLGTCQLDLGNCQQSLGDLEKVYDVQAEELGKANREVTRLTGELEKVANQYNETLALSKLLTEGPEIPDQTKVRWLQASYIEATLGEQLPPFNALPLEKRFWSDSDYLVCPKSSIDFFLDYFKMFWLPHLKYTVFRWKKLDGQEVDIWANDCDDIQDFLQGLPSLNARWSCFPWGTLWGTVEGLFIAGGHAFGFIVCCNDDYKEESPSLTPTKGLKLYIVEPQMAQMWTVASAVGQITKYQLTDIKLSDPVGGAFNVKDVWIMKV